MLFLHPWLLASLAGISIPIIIHLVRRQAAKPVEWGAMRFLMDTLSERRRRMEWEDLLLMIARCLLLALAALAIARPFIPPDSPTPWSFVLPAVLLGIALFGGSFVLTTAKKRLLVRAAALVLMFIAAGMVIMEHWLHLKRFETSGSRDVVIIIDASASMTRSSGTHTVFDDALDETRRIVKDAPRGTSFAIILGGPSPVALTHTPVSHRADVLAQLDGLQALGGVFRAHEALGMATLILADGERPNKDIIILTDSQRNGWQLENAGAWKTLADAWKSLPAKPRLLIRSFPPAASLRNAGIASITTPRDLTGTDRPCLLRTEIINTGTEPVTPEQLLIEVDGKPSAHEPLGLLVPGQSQVIETHHPFTSAGPHVVTARLAGRDEMPADNRADMVVNVRKSVKVVLVDGNPAGSFFERAAGHTALALAPAVSLLKGGTAGKEFLMDPQVIPAPELTAEQIDDADVVILADVSRLPSALAATLADHTAAGAGLIVLAGPRVETAFYNTWDGPDGLLLPLKLDQESLSEKGISPVSNTFRHEALAWAKDDRHSDLSGAVIRRWRKSSLTAENSTLAAAFGNGDAFLATRGYGHGRSVVATCAFDARAGNLPGRASFVPLVHELVAWSAGGGVALNLDPAWSPSVVLDSRSSGGLAAVYAKDHRKENILLERTDPSIRFDWGDGAPAPKLPRDQFTVTWKGLLMPQISGEYLLDAEVDDSITIKISGNTVLEARERQTPQGGRVHLEAGKPVPIEAAYEEESGLAYVKLYWTPPGGVRQIIPSSAWIPNGGEKSPTYEAVDPSGRMRKATISAGRRGRELRMDGPAVPGLYQVQLPAELRASVLPGSGPLPVVVRNDIAESRLESLNAEDYAQLRARADLFQPSSVADVLAVLSGRGFGREMTRLLVVAALLLLLLETALARWVSRSRRAGDDLQVEFGATTVEKGGWQ